MVNENGSAEPDIVGESQRPNKHYCLVTIAEGTHPFPFRTRKLSPPAPMVLPNGGRVGRRQAFLCPDEYMDIKKLVVNQELSY